MMAPGSLSQDIDLVQVMLVVFLLFFIGLIVYLRREDKREGYPLLSRMARRSPIIGWPAPPPVKTYRLIDGGTAQIPHDYPQEPVEHVSIPRNGEPLHPPGDLLLAGVGAGAYTLRSEEPMRTLDGELLLMPLRDAKEWSVWRGDLDPRGKRVLGSDYRAAGKVHDIWVDRAAKILRYFEVELDDAAGTIIVPIFHTDIDRTERDIRVLVLKPEQMRLVPRLAQPDIITAREEDRINAFYAGATLYGDPSPPIESHQ
jgi:photosynthetic reaction center H subunit